MSDPASPIIAGLATLDTLKQAAIPAIPADNAQFDTIISRLGTAVAIIFELQTRRKLARRVDDQYIFNGDRAFVCVPRYPLEAVSGFEFLSYGDAPNAWAVLDGDAVAINPDAGLIEFGGAWGSGYDRVRVTYTGGFWIDDGGEMPPGATPVPDDLLQAFYLQCAQQFEAQDILGAGVVKDEKTDAAAQKAGTPLLPIVSEILANYARLA